MVDLKNREEVLKAMEERTIFSLEEVDKSLSSDIEIVKKALKDNGPEDFEFVHESLKKDREFIFNILDEDVAAREEFEAVMLGLILEYVGEEFKKDKEFVTKCMQACDEQVLKFAHEDLLKDFDFIKDLIITHDYGTEFLEDYVEESLASNKELIAICEENERIWG